MAFDVKKFLDQQGVSHLWSKVAASIKAEETRAKAAEEAALAAAQQAQKEVDALETFVGALPEGTTATSVVDYVDKKVAGAATDSTNALNALSQKVDGVDGRLATVEADYLKAADKTELQGNIDGVDGRLATVEGDYLKAADKTELQRNIDTVSGKVTTLVGEDANKSVRTIANEELAAQLIAEGAAEALDTLQEIAAWIQAHPGDASAMNQAIVALQNKVDTGDKNVSVFVADAIAALNIGDYAKAADLTELAGRVKTLEDAGHLNTEDVNGLIKTYVDGLKLGETYDTIASVNEKIAGVVGVDGDVGTANTIFGAKAYAKGLNDATNVRVKALEDAGYQNASQVGTAIDNKIAALDLANTYEAKGEAAAAYAAIQALTNAEIDAAIASVTAG